MSMNILNAVGKGMTDTGLNYKFGEWGSEPTYPYWIGEYQEVGSMTESGMQETSFLLTGFARGKGAYRQLELDKEKIKHMFHPIEGLIVTTDDKSVVAIFYDTVFNNLPTGDAELKKVQVNLLIKEWSVI